MNIDRSPKGRMRMTTLALLTLVAGFICVRYASPIITESRFQEWAIRMVAAASINVAFYWGMRIWVLHHRTHELTIEAQFSRQNALLVAHAIVTAGVFTL